MEEIYYFEFSFFVIDYMIFLVEYFTTLVVSENCLIKLYYRYTAVLC